MAELSKNTTWSGEHKGVHYSVSLHGEGLEYRPQGTWCYYISLHEDQIPADWREKFDLPPEKDDKGRVNYPYMGAWFADLDWHCGITYYEKKGGVDGAKLMFKMGCDYAHYWDEGYNYDLEWVQRDAIKSIDKLLEEVPLLVRCSWDSCYHQIEAMTKWGSGYISNDCIEARNASFPDAEPISARTV